MNPDEYEKKILQEVANQLDERIKLGLIKPEYADKVAKYILEALKPHMSLEQIYKVMQDFGTHFQELEYVTIQTDHDIEQVAKKIIVEKVDKLLKENKIAEADAVLKTSLADELQVVK